MNNFKSTEQPKKNIKDITVEYAPFWQPYFAYENINNPKFGAKLCYMGKEFGEERVECIRFWPSELSCGKDFYVELFNWDHEHYVPGTRVLYKLVSNPNWELNPNKYVIAESNVASGKQSYAVRLSDLEIVNKTSTTSAYADVTKNVNNIEVGSNEEEFSDIFSEKEDSHYSSMTLRDHYCITQNVPFSNKQWLNELIKTGIAWQQKNQK